MLQTRPPVVVVLGHVDHGKTTLLDAIRKTNIASREAGGITQSIGASKVITKEKKVITFIDTPGHAAFLKMRSQGAKVADVAILVVSADDGVKPQTRESLEIIRQANLPFVVAITKIDLPSADIEVVLQQLEKEGVRFEGRGGQIPKVPVSAKKRIGIDDLLTVVSLLAEVSGMKGTPTGPLEAVVIETIKDRRGSLVSVVVKDGKLQTGQTIYTKEVESKIKALFDWQGRPVREVLPGEAALILGFPKLPAIGERITNQKIDLQPELFSKKEKKKAKKGDLIISLKAQTKGALEAIKWGLPQEVFIAEAGVGEVTESDVLMAKASGARIFAFGAKVSPTVAKLAAAEGVQIEKFTIIYELLDKIKEILSQNEVEILGRAEIIAIFPFNKKRIAGCHLIQGKISKTDGLILKRQDKELGKVKIISLRKQKQEVSQVVSGEEFGLLFEPQLDFQIGDVLTSVAHGK